MKKKTVFLTLCFLIGTLTAGYVMFVAGKEVYRGRKIDREIENLQAEADRIRSENGDLKEKIAYLDSDQFRERIAKEKLNLKKEGENVVEVISSTPSQESEGEKNPETKTSESVVEEKRNYIKWWKEFFNY